MRRLGNASLLFALLSGPATAQDAARAVVEKAIQAHGGAAVLDRHQASRVRVKATLSLGGGEIPAVVETVAQLPGQFKTVIQMEIDGKTQSVVQVLNGDVGWMSIDGKTRALDAGELAARKESFYADHAVRLTPLLKDKNYRLSTLPEAKVDGRPAVGVKIAYAGRADIHFYFDKASGLLVKSDRRTKGTGKKDVLQEEVFRDYKAFGGAQRPTKFVVFRDGKKFMEGMVLNYTPLEKVDAKEFAKP